MNGTEQTELDTETSHGTPSDSNNTENHTGQCPQSLHGLPPPPAFVSGIIIRRPGERMYGILTLTLSLPTKLVSYDYYGADISEMGKRVILGSLDAIAKQLSMECGTISSEIPLPAPECPTVPSEKERLGRIISDVQAPQQRLLWDDSGE